MKNKFQSMVAYAPIAEPCAAKAPQNTGGGNSQCSVLQYESALLIPTVNRRSTDGQSQRHYKQTPLSKRWKVLMTLVFLFTFAIGNVWAADVVMTPTGAEYTKNLSNAATNGMYFARAAGKVNKVTIGNKDYVNPSQVAFIFKLAETDTIKFNFLRKSSGSSTCANFDIYAVSDTLYTLYKFANLNSKALCNELITWNDSVNTWKPFYTRLGITSVSDNNTKYLTSETTGKWTKAKDTSKNEYSKPSSIGAGTLVVGEFAAGAYMVFIKFGDSSMGIENITLTAPASTPSTTYTVTLNPNEGSYASTPEGWTASAGNYTKTVSAGALTIPAPARDGYDFNGWKAGETAVTLTDGKLTVAKDTTLVAQWVTATTKYDVTYSAGAGSGTVPASAKYAEGAKFNLPGQGEMVAPSGKAFDGWKANGTGDKLAANAEYTMTAADVNFVAQWKAAPTTIFDWTKGSGAQITADNTNLNGNDMGTLTTGTSVVARKLGTNNIDNNNAGYKLGNNDVCIEIQGTSNFQEGDTVIIRARGGGDGERGCAIASSSVNTAASADTARTNLINDKNNERTYTVIVTSKQEGAKIRVFRMADKTMYIKSIKVIRPAERPIASTVISLTDVKVNNRSISSDSLTTLVSAKSLLLKDEYAVAPVIKFNEHKVITYSDGESPATKTTDKVYTVTATTVEGKWQASQTINEVAYTVTATKVSSAKVYYYDGSTKLGEETVAIDGSPEHAGDYDDKNLASFDGWYSNADLEEEHKIANIAALTVSKDTTVYGKWTYKYAVSTNIEQWVLTNGAGKTATTKTSALISQLGANNFASNLAWENGNLELDSLDDDPSKDARNNAYLGLKVKKGGKMLDFRLAAGKTVKVKFGAIKSTLPQVAIDGGSYANMSITDKVYTYTAAADAYISIKTADNNAVVFKQIMIGDAPEFEEVALPYLVTFNAGTGTCETAKLAGASVTLPAVTAPEDYTFAGWFDEATGGANKGLAGATYVPTDNVTLYAHFDPVKYTITYAAGLGSGEMAAAEAGWGTEYTALGNGFTAPTGYIFAGWTVTGVDGVSSIGNLGSFTMPKGNVTLTAIWEDNSKVAMNVETSEKYATLAAAIAAATDGQTIQLLQNIEQADGVLIDKNLVLDLNGKTYTCTNGNSYNNRAIKVTAGDVTIKNGTIDALSNEAHTDGCYGGLRIEGGNVTCEEVTFKNYRIYGLGLKVTGGHLELNECTVISEIGGGLEVAGGTAEVNNCIFTQTGLDTTHKWISTCLASSEAGSLTVNGGTYTSEYSSLYIYSTGGDIDVEAGSFTGDVVLTTETTPAAPSVINIKGGDFTNFEVKTPASSNCDINISGGTFDAPVENKYCADGYVPAPEVTPGVYTVEPKDGIEIIGVVTTGGTNKTVSGLYKGDASVSLDSNKKLGGDRYIYVTLASGYTFEETDVLVVDVLTMSDLTATKNLEITTGVGNINGEVWKSLTGDEYAAGLVTIPLKGIAAGQTSIGLKRSANQNAYINGLKVYRPMNPILTAITINGVACVKGEGNTFSITLPEEGTNLASLEVVPTVIRNAAHATTPEAVISNSGAWKAGDNTYRVMDKDGDYTDYTITITLQGQAPAPDITTQPLTQAYCAGNEPTLEVEATGNELHYAWFKEAGETDQAVGTDAASYTIASAGTYYVIITNHVDGKLDASVTSTNAVVTLNVAAAITTQPTNKRDVVAGSEVTLSVVATNATSYQWYSCDDAEKHGAAAIPGAEVANYVFTCNANGFYYCVVGNACGEDLISDVVSVKLEPEGCNLVGTPSGNAYTQAGEWSIYPVNSSGQHDPEGNDFGTCKAFDEETDVNCVNTRRFAIKFEKDVESVTIYARGGAGRTFDKVSVADEMAKNAYTELTDITKQLVTIDGAGKEYIATAEGMIPGGKYAWFDFSGSFSGVFKICYTEAIEKPVIATQPATKIDFAAGDMTATVVVNAVTEGTLKYQWYNADGDVAVEGATSATLTTTEEGTYYVIVRNTLAGHKDYAVKSDEATLAYRQMNDATLSALSVSAGALDPAFDKAVVEYRVDLAKGTTTVPTLTATATMAAYGATAVVTNAAEFENYEAISTVLVTAEDGESQKTYTVHYYVAHAVTTLADVTENTTWDWSLVTKKADGTTISGDGPKLNENEDGLILANYLSGDDFDKLEGNDDAYAIRNSSDKKVYQGASLRMHTTKGGYLSIWAANEGHTMTLNVTNAGRDMELATLTGSQVEYKLYVQAGDVRIYNVSSASKPMRVSKIVFTVKESPDYTRPVSNNIGTLCVEHNVLAGGALGATFYQIASRNETYPDKIDFEEVLPGEELKAGQPYIFRSNTGKIELFYGDSVANDPVAVRGMIGNYAASHLDITDDNKYDILYIAQNKLWMCGNLVGGDLILNDHRAYIVMSEVPTYEAYEASKQQQTNGAARRRVTLGMNSTNVATGLENVQGDHVQATKVLIDGQLYILRGEKMYDAKGQLVK